MALNAARKANVGSYLLSLETALLIASLMVTRIATQKRNPPQLSKAAAKMHRPGSIALHSNRLVVYPRLRLV